MAQEDPESLRQQARRLFDDGDPSAAAGVQQRLVALLDHDGRRYLRDYLFLSMYLRAANHLQAASEVLEKIADLGSDDLEYHLNLGTLYYRLQRLQDARKYLLRARELDRGNGRVLVQLSRVFSGLGKRTDAVRCGEIALLNQAREVARARAYKVPKSGPAPIDLERPGQNIIAFSLADYSRERVTAALRNVVCAASLYPGWTCRFYVAHGVPQPVVRELARNGAQVAMVSQAQGRFRGVNFWALHVLGDRKVKYFLIRDVQNLVNIRERAAVQEWLASGRWFHLMRDHCTHGDLIVPGLWGGATGVLPPVQQLMKQHRPQAITSGSGKSTFLQHAVWPTLRKSCLQHDSQYRALKSQDFPSGSELPGSDFVGNPVAARVSLPLVRLPDYEEPSDERKSLVSEAEQLLF